MRTGALIALAMLTAVGLAGAPAQAFEAEATFQRGAMLLSIEGGIGVQDNIEDHPHQTDLEFWYGGARVGWVPWGVLGGSVLRGAPEIGLEALYLRYVEPVDAFYGGLAAVGRYHFLALGRFVPYVEVGAAAGGTDLRTREIDSDFAFLLFGGVGASVFVTDSASIYAGYRLMHVSNGNIDLPNRGFESHAGVAGVSLFFK